MADHAPQALAQALLADPSRPVDPDAVAAVDREELAIALRGAVAHLPAAEQRTRLAAAFRAIAASAPAVDPASTAPYATTPSEHALATAPYRRSMSMRPFNLARTGAMAGVLVVALLAGVLAGAITGGSGGDDGVVPAAAQNPVPVLEPIAVGDDPPSEEFIAGLLPPDPEVEAGARRDAIENHDGQLADDEADVGADDGYLPEITDDRLPILGYADAPARRDASGAGNNRPGDEPAAADDDGSENDAPGDGEPAPGAAAPGDDREPPGLVDLCAVEDPPDGCEGVGGTVTLALVEAFRFNVDPEAVTYWPACADRRDLEPDEFLFMLSTNNLGSFTVRYRLADSDDDFTELTGDSPGLWRDALDDGSTDQVVTCLAAERPDDARPLRLDVDIVGVGDQDSGMASFTGVLDLAAAPEPDPLPESRAGRPRVRVEALTSSRLRVTVPAGENEVVRVGLAHRAADGSASCDTPVVRASQLTTVRAPGGIHIMSDWENKVFDVSALEPGLYVVCVGWFDDVEPPRNLERATIPVDIEALHGAELIVAGYTSTSGCMGGGCPPRPVAVDVIAQNPRCGSELLADGDLRGLLSEPRVMCVLHDVPARVTMGADARFEDNPRLGQLSTATVRVNDRCSGADCTTWYTLPVRNSGGQVFGLVTFGLRLTGGGPARVAIGGERPELTDADDSIGPRLRWRRVSAEPDPADPSRSAIIAWESDVPARVSVTVETLDNSTCARRRAAVDELVTEGTLRVGGLCPGERHYVGFTLVDEDGTTSVYDVIGGARGDFYEPRSALVQMPPMLVTFDYDLTFREFEFVFGHGFKEVTGRGVIPTRMEVVFPGSFDPDRPLPPHEYRYSQWFDRRAYFGLDCSNPSHFNRSASGIKGSVVGGTFAPPATHFVFHTYVPTQRGNFDSGGPRVCPSFFNQVHRTPSDPTKDCTVVIGRLEPIGDSNQIDRMLRGEEAVFRTQGLRGRTVTDGPPMRCGQHVGDPTYLAVTLTVRLRGG